ncbi:MAG: amidohydrolase family protein [Acidimicrobiales bacterium]
MTTFVVDPDWLYFDPQPSTPSFVLPDGAVDAHCHVFGPANEFPFSPERKYTPCDAGKDQLFALRDHLGFTRNVIVQATCHGSTNDAMVDALRSSNGLARGVATIEPTASDQLLGELHDAGVRAVRFNYVRRLVDPEEDEYYQRIVEKIAPLGWHVVVYFEAQDLAEKWALFTSFPTVLVVDHLGRPDVSQPVDGESFNLFVRFMEENPTVWAKVTCPERLSNNGLAGFSTTVPFYRRVIDAFPDRVLWGTDWPHPNLKSFMPDDGKLVDFIPSIATTPDLQQRLLVDNPMRLYWKD